MTTPQGLILNAVHDAAQVRLLDRGLAELTLAFSTLLDPLALDATTPLYLPVAADVVRANRARAAALATTHYNALRLVETAGGHKPPPYTSALAPEPPVPLLRTSLAVTGPVTVKASVARGLALEESVTRALTSTLGAATRHILGGPRDVARLNSARDPASPGWMRRSGGTPCAFCAMLIARGPVYSEGTSKFTTHDHCHCHAVPFFRSDPGWTAQSTEFEALWRESNGKLNGPGESFSKVYRERYPKVKPPSALPLAA